MRTSITKKLTICIIWIGLWIIISLIVDNPIFLPSPMDTLRALARLGCTGAFYLDVLATILRCTISIIIAFGLGALAAFAAHRHPWIREFLSLPVAFFKAVPVMAIIIYLILLANSQVVPIIVAFLMCFPIVYTNILTGLDGVDIKLLEMGKVFSLRPITILRFITIPSIMPQIKASLSLIAGLSWKAVVTAEVLSIPKFSLGYKLIDAKYYLETPNLFAYILVIVCLSVLFEKLIKALLNTKSPASPAKSHSPSTQADSPSAQADSPSTVADFSGKSPKGDGVLVKAINHIKVCGFSKTFTPSARPEGQEDGGKADAKAVTFPDRTFPGAQTSVIMAPSGSGKTTLLRAMAGLIHYEGEITGLPDSHRIAMIFQEDRLLPWLNVYDNIAIVLNSDKKHGDAGTHADAQKPGNPCDHEHGNDGTHANAQEYRNPHTQTHSQEYGKVLYILKSLGLEEALYKYPSQLSGGMQHRVAIGRALAYPSDLLLVDEPFRGLDQELKHEIINGIWREYTRGKTVVVATHSVDDEKELLELNNKR